MKRARVSLVATLTIACGIANSASAAGITICDSTREPVGFALGYVHAQGLESAGPFEAKPGKCATFLTTVAKGPFYVYGEVPTGAMAWTGHGAEGAHAFCRSTDPHIAMRNKDYMKDGKLTCPDDAVGEFFLVPDVQRGRPKFTFSEDNADRP